MSEDVRPEVSDVICRDRDGVAFRVPKGTVPPRGYGRVINAHEPSGELKVEYLTLPYWEPGNKPAQGDDVALAVHDVLGEQARERGGGLLPGQPCRHPGCASHVLSPCEGCGRYQAGLAEGPPETLAGEIAAHQQNMADLGLQMLREKADVGDALRHALKNVKGDAEITVENEHGLHLMEVTINLDERARLLGDNEALVLFIESRRVDQTWDLRSMPWSDFQALFEECFAGAREGTETTDALASIVKATEREKA